MTVSAAPAIFDAYNARQLTPQEVARSFIPPSHFSDLINPRHSLVVGPRGSGKTTLLKMLHPAALESWDHPEADGFRRKVSFTGVFIATDINWNEQVKSLGEGRLDDESQRAFIRAAFTTQVLLALAESMGHRAGRFGEARTPYGRVEVSPKEEKFICSELSAAWELDKTIPTFEGLRLGLSRRLLDVRKCASLEATRLALGRQDRIAALGFLHLDFLSAARVAVELFNSRTKVLGHRWAFLFDELELAPPWIRVALIRYLRSVDDRFLFKFSLSPYSVDIKKELEQQQHPAAPGQDFDAIKLWYVNKEQAYPFCRELLKSILERKELPALTAEKLFGVSDFFTEYGERSSGRSAYSSASKLGKLYQGLSESDSSFREYLERKGLDPFELDKATKNKQAADVRKVRSIVALRAYFRGAGNDIREDRKRGRRSRKVPTVYGGATSLFAMVEGNPRWLKGIVGQLLTGYASKRALPIAKSEQVRRVLEAAHIFLAMLRTLPSRSDDPERRGLLSLLDPVGNFFGGAAIDGKFDPDPPCSFIVDDGTPQEELEALGMALNAGAIVYDTAEEDTGLLQNLIGERFRISYILAPHYFVPLVLGRGASLQRILSKARSSTKPVNVKHSEPTLFSKLEDQDAGAPRN